MRVLFLTYPRIGMNRGGLQIQIEETAQGLTDIGVEVIRYDPWQNQIPNVDACHVFSVDGSMVYHTSRAVSLGVPVILSPVLNAFDTPPHRHNAETAIISLAWLLFRSATSRNDASCGINSRRFESR